MNKLNMRIITIIMTSMFIFTVQILSAGTAYAAFFDGLHGTPKSEKVDIEVESYRDNDGNLEKTPELVRIKAGDDTSYIPVIVNKGIACNLRIRVQANTGKKKINILKYCYGFEDNWSYEDGWFYCRQRFEKDKRIRICEGFHFPDEWEWRKCNLLDITVEAEAVADEDMPDAVTTGDDSRSILIYGCIALVSIFTAFMVYFRGRKKDNESI